MLDSSPCSTLDDSLKMDKPSYIDRNVTLNSQTQNFIKNDRCILSLNHGIPIVILNSFLVFIGTFGNLLIVFAVLSTHRLRRKISNFLLVSLAFADLFVTMCAQPLHATSVAFTTFAHHCVPKIDFAYDVAANFSVFCSLFHLAAISIDRAMVVTKPHRHPEIMKKYGLKTMLGVCWGVAFVFASIRVPFPETLVLSIALIVFNYFIIIICYAVILYQITRDKVNSDDPAAAISPASRDLRMERRVAGTIAIIIFFFSLCWFPLLGFYSTVKNAVLRHLGGVTYMWIRTAVLSNSSMNFIVYSWRIDHFRVAYLRTVNKMLHKPRELFRFSQRMNVSVGLSQGGSKDNEKIIELTADLEGIQKDKRKERRVTARELKRKVSFRFPNPTISRQKKSIDNKKDEKEVETEREISYSNIILSNPVFIFANKATVNENL